MGTTLEVLVTRLEAQTEQYEKALRGARKVTDKSTKGINKAIGSMIVKFASFAAAVIIARKAYRIFTAGLARIDKLAKTARFLGITTEALAGLQHLSNLTGVSIGNLETAMMRMTRAIGEASTGAKEYLEPFERIGVDAQKLLRLAPEKQMAAIAEGISTLATQTEQGAVSMEIFGRSGLRMRNLLREGSKGFRDAEAAAKGFGLAVTESAAKKVEDANDAITRMKAALTGMANQAVIVAAPAIEEAANATTGFIAEIKEVIGWLQLEEKALGKFRTGASLRAEARAQARAAEERAEARTTAEKKVQKALTEIQKEGDAIRAAFDAASSTRKSQMVLGNLRDMVSAIGTESRTMFEISKGLAYAEAVVNTAAGITRSLAAYPQPLAGIMAGITAAAGAAQIAAIASTQYQKGGGGAGAGAAGGVGAGAVNAGGAAEAATPLDVNVVLQGDNFGPAGIRNLIGKIDDELADGVRMRSITVVG